MISFRRHPCDVSWPTSDGPCVGRAGSFTVTTDASFDRHNPATRPISFSQSFNLRPEPLSNTCFGMFVQDDWRIRDNFTLNLGIGWDVDLRVRDRERHRRRWCSSASACRTLPATEQLDAKGRYLKSNG